MEFSFLFEYFLDDLVFRNISIIFVQEIIGKDRRNEDEYEIH
jgi:hypothetical protein